MQLQLRSRRPAEQEAVLEGQFAQPEHAQFALTGDCTVFKPDGKRLLLLRRNAIPSAAIDEAWDFMRSASNSPSNNRSTYAGPVTLDRLPPAARKRGFVKMSGNRYHLVKEDGTVSNTYQGIAVRSAVAGFLDPSPRIPYCRESALTTRDPAKWGRALPFIQSIAKLFEETLPDRYAKQLVEAKATHPAYVLPGTPFTSITVNNTVAGAYHYDAGDFKDGFGVMAVFRKGSYAGGDIVFPTYGVSADLQHGDVIFFDAHELHGNIPFRDQVGVENEDWIRVSMVFYFRTKMRKCLSPAEEMARTRNLHGALPLGDDGDADQ